MAKEEEGIVDEDDVVEEQAENEEDTVKSRAELDHQLASLHAQVDELTSSKKFDEASAIQQTINSLEELKSKFPSLSELENKLTDLKKEFDDAISTKEFNKAGDIQKEIDQMEEMIKVETLELEKYPSIMAKCEEKDGVKSFTVETETGVYTISSRRQLDQCLSSTSHKVDIAISLKDFDNATKFQKSFEQFQEILPSFPSLLELEEQLSKKQKEFDEAVSRKEFDVAGKLHQDVEALEEKLREEGDKGDDVEESGASGEELGLKLKELKDEYKDAMDKKDYTKIGDLYVQMNDTEREINSIQESNSNLNEKSVETTTSKIEESSNSYVIKTGEESLTISTRQELDQNILSASHQVDVAASLKDFTNATLFQTKLDKLQELKSSLLSIPELTQQLESKKLQMESAIQKKDFAAAGTLHDEVEDLEKILVEEKEKELPKKSDKSLNDMKVEVKEKEDKYKAAKTEKDYAVLGELHVKINQLKEFITLEEKKSIVSNVAPTIQKQKPIKAPVNNSSVSTRPTVTSTDDAMSVRSGLSKATPKRPISTNKNQKNQQEKSVDKLRPKKPLLCGPSDTVLQVCQAITNKRDYAALISNQNNGLIGIITDKDIVRRVLARDIEASTTLVSSVMTKNPTFVYTSDKAMDALGIMIENRYRHLPVVDEKGEIRGLLNISKCLNDAITKLEKKENGTNKLATDVLGETDTQKALQMLLGSLLNQAQGKSDPTLRSLLTGKPATIVRPDTSIKDAGILMAERTKAALVVDDGELLGIVSFKDIMSRAIAKELDLTNTDVTAIMTPNPEVMSPDATTIEALQLMHDYKFLTIPVCEDNGTVVGLVDVMDVIYGCGGDNGWRSIFGSYLDIDDDSETASVRSNGSRRSAKSRATSVKSAFHNKPPQSTLDDNGVKNTVAKLRPNKPLISMSSDSVLQVTQMLAKNRGLASIIANPNSGALEGIITDKDFTRRIVAKFADPSSTSIASVMTPNPTYVSMSDSAMEALTIMIDNRYVCE